MNTNKFRHGNILSLKLSNFQTYEYQEFKFGPGLNLIAGPNGSGKSSIANSLAFIFNGTPKTIGKSRNIKDYVKFGSDSAVIECVVCKKSPLKIKRDEVKSLKIEENENINLKRKIGFKNGKPISEFFINGALISNKEYFKFVSILNIDCNNLTNFLPQEKVSEFVKLNSRELFTEVSNFLTSKKDDLSLIEDLYTLQNEIELLNVTINTETKKIERIDDNLDVLAKEMEKELQFENNLRAIKLLNYKEKLIESEKLKYKLSSVEVSLKDVKQKLKEEEKKIVELESKVKEYESRPELANYKKVIEELSRQNDRIFENCSRMNELLKKLQITYNERERIESENRRIKEDNETANIRKRKEEKILAELKSDLKNKITSILKKSQDPNIFINENNQLSLPEEAFCKDQSKFDLVFNDLENDKFNIENIEAILPKKEFIEAKRQAIQEKNDKFQSKSKTLQTKIEQLTRTKNNYNSAKAQRMELLYKFHPDTYKAVEYLRKNDIGVEYLEPSFLHIEIANEFKDELESLLSFIQLTTFLFKNSSDMHKFSKVLKDQMKLKINLSVADFSEIHIPKPDKRELELLGIEGVAFDYLIADTPYKNYYTTTGMFNYIPVSKNKIDDQIVIKTLKNVKRMIFNKLFIEIKGNRYNNEIISKSVGIKPRDLFSYSVDVSKIDKQLSILDRERKINLSEAESLLNEKNNIEEAIKIHNNNFGIHNITSILHSIVRVEQSIKEIRLKQLIYYDKNEILNIKNKIKSEYKILNSVLAKNKIPKINIDKVRDIELNYNNNKRDLSFKKNAVIEIKKQYEDRKKYEKEYKTKVKEVTDFLERIEEKEKDYNEKVKSLQIKSVTGRQLHVDPILCFKEEVLDLPEDEIDIRAKINSLTCANKVLNPRGTIKGDFISRETEYEKIKFDIETMRKKRDGKIKKFESDKLKIYENLNNNLKIVSQRFQGFLRMFGFDGLLELNFGQEDEDKNDNDENDFNSGKFLMNIFVKFRANDALRKLSASRQSGGEKSLTTVLFLLALHDNNTLFKLVDEINQGMDSNNEKRVFEVLKTMSETSQFFIITPKLLHDFSYPENCLVTILYGGENMKVLEKYVSSK